MGLGWIDGIFLRIEHNHSEIWQIKALNYLPELRTGSDCDEI